MTQPRFSHVPNVTGYMRIVVSRICQHFPDLAGKTVLDFPAGNGWVGDQLRHRGANVTSADINEERPDFKWIDMEKTLPFENETYDVIVCAEGIEHIFSPYHLLKEFSRMLRPGGILIITTPNIQNLYSRFQFLCTGYLFQFHPFEKIPLEDEMMSDKGHISPVSYLQLRYFSRHFGLTVEKPDGDRMKRRVLFPLLFPFLLIGKWWAYKDWKRAGNDPEQKEILGHLFGIKILLSRSIIFIAKKGSTSPRKSRFNDE
uniref:2-polyprenyl-3-methyl-5-hydroxy-6-metoxy-1,4-benzoquinol methylase n=1 Tax=Candidatus Kentrum sp. DK TaxID=2126562 RepID=A0A450S240_9GAMM|nr:MAG: 2-polyprenyl-3-methyl-5-hydroxy-6-metoxy-1,4-benzoquinol methylase [Candidatus Kentron sp. DK]